MGTTIRSLFPPTDNHYLLIGKVTVYYSNLEWQLAHFISSILSFQDRRGSIITSELAFKQLVAVLFSLYKEIYPEQIERHVQLNKALRKAQKAADERNKIVHSTWGAGENGNITRIKSKARVNKGFGFEFPEYDEAKLNGIVLSIDDSICSIFDLHIKYLKENGRVHIINLSDE